MDKDTLPPESDLRLLGSYGGITVGFMTVDPPLAQSWLALLNDRNRTLNKRWVDKFTRDMLAGRWLFDGMPLRFAGDFERLLDGQHRLAAQIQANVTLTHVVVVGLPDETQDTMDHNRTRRMADVLQIRGVPNSKSIEAVTRGVHAYATIGSAIQSNGGQQPTVQELVERFKANPGISESLVTSRVPGLPSGVLSIMSYLTGLVDEGDSAEFVRLVQTGDALTVGHPIHTLRDRLAREVGKTNRFPSVVRWVFLVRTWNAWQRGETRARLQFKPGGAHPDRVPLIDGINPEDVPS